ncbi:hypothetical protein [Devosia submarina]|uniref:hypothetical protein n=1 Tax=Devosia submarina TaxID=1173082 RepID=UPI000D352AD5|nr:hypothetical protein [Devosia submarina]
MIDPQETIQQLEAKIAMLERERVELRNTLTKAVDRLTQSAEAEDLVSLQSLMLWALERGREQLTDDELSPAQAKAMDEGVRSGFFEEYHDAIGFRSYYKLTKRGREQVR